MQYVPKTLMGLFMEAVNVVNVQEAQVKLRVLGMTADQVEEATALARTRANPLMGLEYLAVLLREGHSVDVVMKVIRRLWGDRHDE